MQRFLFGGFDLDVGLALEEDADGADLGLDALDLGELEDGGGISLPRTVVAREEVGVLDAHRVAGLADLDGAEHAGRGELVHDAHAVPHEWLLGPGAA